MFLFDLGAMVRSRGPWPQLFTMHLDQRRLSFLTDNAYISVNPGAVSNKLPLRLLYPQSEYTTNAENVLKQGTINALTTKLFWEP